MYHIKKKQNIVLSINFLLLSFSLIFAVLLIWLLSFSERWLSFDSKLEFHVISPALAIPNVPTNNTLPSPIENHPPVANAGKNQTVNENATVTLNGITTDPDPNDSDNLNYLWKQTAGPAVNLDDSDTENPEFIAPPVPSDSVLNFSLTASDDKGAESNPDSVSITVKHLNRAPIANAGVNQTVNPGYVVSLDGTGSRDPDSDPISYLWRQTEGPSVKLDDANSATSTFIAPKDISSDTQLGFELAVTDDKNATNTATSQVTVKYVPPPNQSPTANAGSDQTVNAGDTVTLDGTTSSDPDGDQLAYSWIQTAGPHVTLNDPHTATSSFNVPTDITSDTDLTFKLTVTDDQNGTSYDDVRITAKFITPPPSDQTGQPPQGTVTCGQVVEGNITLTANLNCTEDGLIVGDEATTINLNGFGIFGPGTDSLKVGIGVSEDSVAINGPGNISGFQLGVLAMGANDLQLTEVNLENNEIGISSSAVSNSKIHNNIMKNNGIAIVWNSSTYVNIESNTMQNNRLGGIFFSDTDQSSINNNDISGSQNGILVDPLSSDNFVSLNSLSDNTTDLNNAGGLPPNTNANNFLDNTCSISNPPGLCVAS